MLDHIHYLASCIAEVVEAGKGTLAIGRCFRFNIFLPSLKEHNYIELLVPIGNSNHYTGLNKAIITHFYLAHGNSFTSMFFTFYIPASKIRYIV